MKRRIIGVALSGVLAACGGATDGDDSGGSGGMDAGAGSGGATGGSAGAGAGGSAGGSTGGSAGASTGGSAGASTGGSAGSATGGASGTGATGGTGGAASTCVGLDYCDCKGANANCQVFSETCFCPCGVEPCEPLCSCACGGGKYLGCGPKSMLQPGAIEGIWLIGWAGGLNHYSWIRFNADLSADILDGANLPVNAPLWPCTGKVSYSMAAKPETFFVYLPTSCGTGTALTFEKLGPPSDGYVKGSVLTATITAGPGQTLEGYKFGPSQCDAAMTTCKNPF